VVIYEARGKAGGLNEYGIAAYKTTDGFAQREVQWLLSIGGIRIEFGHRLDSAAALQELRDRHDAVFLSVGLSDTHQLGIPGEDLAGVQDAVRFIETLRQASDMATVPVGRRVVVIGGGMTAIDASTQSKLLGAEIVDMVYRRGPGSMSASTEEQKWAQTHGVTLHHWLAPVAILGHEGHVVGVRFERQQVQSGKLVGTGNFVEFQADMVLKAIGQKLGNDWLHDTGLSIKNGKIETDAEGQTSLPGVWAGGDCREGGLDLTVEAAQHGKLAARAIDRFLNA
jgi:glutamate synthase (NADPH/NADH) small chain